MNINVARLNISSEVQTSSDQANVIDASENKSEPLNSKTLEATSIPYAMDVASTTDILEKDKVIDAYFTKTTTQI